MIKPSTKDFESFLIDKHAEQYDGLDDEMPDACSEWIAELDVDTLIAYADVYASEKAIKAVNKAIESMKVIFK